MSALRVRLRSEMRRGWRSWLGLAVLIGCLGGIVLASAAGARRTDSAFPRLLASTNAPDFIVSAASNGLAEPFYDDVAALPGVAAAGTVAGAELRLERSEHAEVVDAMVSLDGRFGSQVSRPKLLAGRLPNPKVATEALVNRQMADLVGAWAGTEITAFSPPTATATMADYEPVRLTIVGVVIFPQQIVPSSVLEASPQLYLSPGFGESFRGPRSFDGVAVKLLPGAVEDEFRRQVDELAERHDAIVGGEIFVSDESEFHAKTRRAIRPQSLALGAFAVLAGAAVLLVVAQTLSRQLSRDAAEYPVLQVLGMTRGQVVLLALGRAVLVGGLGAAVAVAVAVVSSPLMPIGPARLAEPDPGLSADLGALGWGFVAIIAALVGWTAIPAWRAASAPAGRVVVSEPDRARRRSRLAAAAAGAGLPPVAATGARMALDPAWGPAGVPIRSTVAGTAMALAAVTAALTFGANLDRLVTTPTLYGRSWDMAVDSSFGAIPLEAAAPVLRAEPAVAAFAGGNYGEVAIDGRAIPAVGIDRLEGDAFPTLLEGRASAGPDEIVLGTKSLAHLGRSVGDTVEVERGEERATMRVVGRAVFPKLGRGSFPPTGLGEGAVVAADLLPPLEAPPDSAAYSFYLVRLRAGSDEATRNRVSERLQAEICSAVDFCYVDLDQRPADISTYSDVRRTPLVLAGLLIGLAVATLGHALATSVRRRRRDLAVFRTIGFVRRQVSGAVAWQATTVAIVAGIIGVPLGLAAGRWAWLVFADQVGIALGAVVPLVAVAVAIPAAVIVANLVAAIPGRMAARAAPAVALRAE